MTNHDKIAEAVKRHREKLYREKTVSPYYSAGDVDHAFASGAKWQAEQPTEQRLVPRLHPPMITKCHLVAINPGQFEGEGWKMNLGPGSVLEGLFIAPIEGKHHNMLLVEDQLADARRQIADLEAIAKDRNDTIERQALAYDALSNTNYRHEEAIRNSVSRNAELVDKNAELIATNKRQAEMILALQAQLERMAEPVHILLTDHAKPGCDTAAPVDETPLEAADAMLKACFDYGLLGAEAKLAGPVGASKVEFGADAKKAANEFIKYNAQRLSGEAYEYALDQAFSCGWNAHYVHAIHAKVDASMAKGEPQVIDESGQGAGFEVEDARITAMEVDLRDKLHELTLQNETNLKHIEKLKAAIEHLLDIQQMPRDWPVNKP